MPSHLSSSKGQTSRQIGQPGKGGQFGKQADRADRAEVSGQQVGQLEGTIGQSDIFSGSLIFANKRENLSVCEKALIWQNCEFWKLWFVFINLNFFDKILQYYG